MLDKKIVLLALSALLSQGYAADVKEVELPEETIDHVASPLLGRAIAIPQGMWETLMSCHAILPNKQMYEIYPKNNLSNDNIKPSTGSSLFKQCGIEFQGVNEDHSGTYELISMVDHQDGQISMTRKKFNMIFSVSEIEIPQK